MLFEKFDQLKDEIKDYGPIYSYFVDKCVADTYFLSGEYDVALRKFKKIKKNCEYERLYRGKLYCYFRIGRIHRLERNYEGALAAYKKMMGLAWVEADVALEARSYEELAVDYFYMGDIAKSEFYYDRFMRGKTENDASAAK